MLPFPDRRSGPRRTADLPRRKWPDIAVSVVLGVLAAGAWQSWRGSDASAGQAWLEAQVDVASARPKVSARPATPMPGLDAARLARWRSQADALTPASVALDETARERWLPRLEVLEGALLDPNTPEPVRIELAQIEAQLLATGVVGPPAE